MSTSIQTEFDWLLARFRPLLRPEEAALFLHDCTPRTVLNFVDDGKLRAFDLSAKWPKNKHALVRIWTYTVVHQAINAQRPMPMADVADILPFKRPTVQAQELAGWFGVDADTVASWNISGPTTDRKNVFYRENVIEFLKAREIGQPSSPVRPTSMSGLDRHPSPHQADGGTIFKR